MGLRVAVIGDELTAAAYRLGGAEGWTPTEDDTEEVFRGLAHDVDLLLVTAEFAGRISGTALTEVLNRARPLLLVIPDVLRRRNPPDIIRRTRRIMGLQS